MAATIEAQRLTESHRLAQARLGAQTVALVLPTWRLVDVDDLDGSFASWVRTVAVVVAAQRSASARLASTYLRTFRTLELGVDAGEFDPPLAEQLNVEALTTSLLVTGPAAIRAARARGIATTQAVATAQARSAGAAMRHALNGGRDTIANTVNTDRAAIGWARATSGAACSFCMALASRGPVYSTETVDFDAHDHCLCSAEPVYRRDTDWTAGSRAARALWNESTAGLHGDAALAAFRHAVGR